MDQEVTSYFDWVNSSVINDIETDFAATFYASEKRSALEVYRFLESKPGDQNEKKKSGANIDPEPVSNAADVERYAVCCPFHRPSAC
jgi:hypothetical protein